MKFIFFILIFVPSLVYSGDEDYFTLNKEKKCFVKAYHKKSFSSADPKKFYNLRIFAKPHHKNTRYSLFKYENQIYVTLTSCLDPANIAKGDYIDLIDSAPTDSDKEVTKASNSRSFSDELRFDENKYYIEIDVGSVSFADKSQIFPYNELDGTNSDGDILDFSKPEKSSYKGKSSLALGAGWRIAESTFLAFKLKHYSGSKKEVVPVTVNGSDAVAEFNYKDTFTSFLVGTKFMFWEKYRFKPILAIYLGASKINSTIDSATKLEVESTGISGLVEMGFEFLFTSNLGIGLTGGYEYLGTRKFKLKKEDETIDEGFTSKMSYSNTFFNLGLRIYFQ